MGMKEPPSWAGCGGGGEEGGGMEEGEGVEEGEEGEVEPKLEEREKVAPADMEVMVPVTFCVPCHTRTPSGNWKPEPDVASQ